MINEIAAQITLFLIGYGLCRKATFATQFVIPRLFLSLPVGMAAFSFTMGLLYLYKADFSGLYVVILGVALAGLSLGLGFWKSTLLAKEARILALVVVGLGLLVIAFRIWPWVTYTGDAKQMFFMAYDSAIEGEFNRQLRDMGYVRAFPLLYPMIQTAAFQIDIGFLISFPRLISYSFVLFLGWAIYELSGGARQKPAALVAAFAVTLLFASSYQIFFQLFQFNHHLITMTYVLGFSVMTVTWRQTGQAEAARLALLSLAPIAISRVEGPVLLFILLSALWPTQHIPATMKRRFLLALCLGLLFWFVPIIRHHTSLEPLSVITKPVAVIYLTLFAAGAVIFGITNLLDLTAIRSRAGRVLSWRQKLEKWMDPVALGGVLLGGGTMCLMEPAASKKSAISILSNLSGGGWGVYWIPLVVALALIFLFTCRQMRPRAIDRLPMAFCFSVLAFFAMGSLMGGWRQGEFDGFNRMLLHVLPLLLLWIGVGLALLLQPTSKPAPSLTVG